MSGRVAAVGAGLYTPGFPSCAAWLAGVRDESEPPPTGELLDKRNRRRASPMTRAVADAYGEALAASGLEAETVASVFGSALGEASTMIALLDQMWREQSGLSPMRFATSVHNAAAGVVSIATHNRGFTTSLGADHDTPAMALLEGIALVRAHAVPVIVACADEASPEGIVEEGQGWTSLSVALALVPESLAKPEHVLLSTPEPGRADLAPPDLAPGLINNPVAGLLDLADAIARRRAGRLRLDRGRGLGYCTTLEVCA